MSGGQKFLFGKGALFPYSASDLADCLKILIDAMVCFSLNLGGSRLNVRPMRASRSSRLSQTSKKVQVPRQCKPLELRQQTKMIPDRAGNAHESHRNLEPLRQKVYCSCIALPGLEVGLVQGG